MSQTRRVLIVDKSTLTCAALQNLLSASRFVLLSSSATTLTQISESCRNFQPDILVMSVNLLPEVTTIYISHLHRENPGTKIVLIAGDDEEINLLEMIRAGISAYILQSEPLNMWQSCFQAVGGTGTYFSAKALAHWQHGPAGMTTNRLNADTLTERDVQLVRLLLEGCTNKEMACKLNLSQHTVNNNLSTLYKKLGVKGRMGALLWSVQTGSTEQRGSVATG